VLCIYIALGRGIHESMSTLGKQKICRGNLILMDAEGKAEGVERYTRKGRNNTKSR
jgi:hypothetical protein